MSTWTRKRAVAGCAIALAALGTVASWPARAADEQACEEKFDFANGLLNGNPAANTPPAPAQAIQNDLHEDYLSIIQGCPTFSHLDLVYNNLAIAYIKLNQPDRVISTLETALQKFPGSARHSEWQMDLVDAYMKAGDAAAAANSPNARADYTRVVQLGQSALPQVTSAATRQVLLLDIGNAQFNTSDFAGAVRTYSSLLATNPPAKMAALALYNQAYADLSLANGNQGTTNPAALSGAISAFQNLVTRYPNDPDALDARLQLGKALYQNKQYAQSATYFRQVLNTPNLPRNTQREATLDLGYAYANAEQYSAALPLLREYAQQNPGTPDAAKANVEVGYILRFKSNPPDLAAALAAYSAAANSSDAATATAAQQGEVAVAKAFVDAKQYQQALPIFQRLLTSTNTGVREDAYYGRAIVLNEAKDPQAAQALAQFLQAYPNSKGAASAAYQLGVLQYAAKQYAQAAQSFNLAARAVQTGTNAGNNDAADLRSEALYWAGNAASQAGQSATAVQSWQQELQSDANYASPYTADTLASLVEYYTTAGQTDQAARYANVLATHYPTNADATAALLNVGAKLVANKQYDAALGFYRQLANSQANGDAAGKALYNLGYTYLQMNQPQQAITYFSQYLQRYPTGSLAARAAAFEGQAYEQTAGTNPAELQRALAAYQQASRLAATDTDAADADLAPQAAFRTAMIESQLKQTNQALQDLNNAITRYPNSKLVAAMTFQRGLIYQGAGQTDQAAAAFQQFLQRYPNDPGVPSAHFNLGVLIYNSAVAQRDQALKDNNAAMLTQSEQRYAQAAQQFEAALAGNTKDVPLEQAYYFEGWAYSNSNQPAKAAQAFKTLLTRYPNTSNATRAMLQLGKVEATIDPADAERYLTRFLATNGTNPKSDDTINANLALGEAYEAAHDCANAQVALQKVVDNTDDVRAAEATYNQARCAEMQGDKNKARLLYEKVTLVFSAATDWVNKAKADLARLQGGTGAGA